MYSHCDTHFREKKYSPVLHVENSLITRAARDVSDQAAVTSVYAVCAEYEESPGGRHQKCEQYRSIALASPHEMRPLPSPIESRQRVVRVRQNVPVMAH